MSKPLHVLTFLFPLLLAGGLRAGEDRELRLHLSPGRWHHVPVRTTLSLYATGVEADLLRHVRAGSLRIELNGHDVTAAFFALAQRQQRVRFDAAGGRLELAAEVDLLPGRWQFVASYDWVWGGGRRFEQTFFTYDPAQVLRDLGPLPQLAGPKPPVRLDLLPPQITITPSDQEFLRDARPKFVARISDTGSGVDPKKVQVLFENGDVTAQSALGLGLCEYQPASNAGNGAHTLTVRATDRAGNLSVASATVIVFAGARKPWFFAPTNQPHPLAHTHHQYQRYSTSLSSAYFHHGVDIRRPNGTQVFASRGGKVTNCNWYGSQPLYFEVEITDSDGFRWQYHHVDQPTVPQAIFTAYQTGGSIADATHIGNVVYWPASAYGQLYHHVHLNVLAPDGRYMNPLNFMLELNDTVKPVVKYLFVAPNLGTSALNNGTTGATISGNIDVIAECEDLVQGEPYQLTLYKTTWEIEPLTAPPSARMPETTFWQFNFLPGGSNRDIYVHDIFKATLSTPVGTRRTNGDYSSRSFLYVVTNRVGSGVNDANGYWATAAKDVHGQRIWPNGSYRVTVRAYDIAGNAGARSIDVTVAN